MKPPFEERPPLPVFLMVDGLDCLVVGGGAVAARKIGDLIECGARVTVVDPQPSDGVGRLHEEGAVRLERRSFEPADLDGTFIVYAATDDDDVNAAISKLARDRGIPVNAVDSPDDCTFISGATVRRGPLRIAVSTSGASPKLAGAIRRRLEKEFDGTFGEYVAAIGEMRRFILESGEVDGGRAGELLAWLAGDEALRLFRENGKEAVWNTLRKNISS